MAARRVIVFGPTGNVGSVAARTAQEQGAKVFLAMRDPQKTIPGLSSEQEKAGGFERVQADLTKSDTVAAAIKQTGAKSAFFYLAFGMPDHMRSTLEAMKSAGIEFVVFLSSFTVSKASLREIPEKKIIPYAHAQVEIGLEEIFSPEHFVAVRPGTFATNTTWYTRGIQQGKVGLYYPDAQLDYITATDMGEVCGTILVKGQRDGESRVTIFGPELLTQKEALAVIAEVLQKDIEVTSATEEEAVAHLQSIGTPEHLARYVVNSDRETYEGNTATSDLSFYQAGVSSIQKYTGRPATTFRAWLQNNKDIYD